MATVLVVDDRPFNREFLSILLQYVGHTVIEANDGRAALSQIARQYPDLVITDILMPGMDGLELVSALRADPDTAGIPVIFYTATYRSHEASAMAAALGVSAVITKPAEPQGILDTVNRVLGTGLERHGWQEAPDYPGTLASRPGSKLGKLQLCLQQSVTQGLELLDRSNDPGNGASVAGALGTVQRLSLRIAALIELGLELPSIRDGQQLLEFFCRAAQDIMNARQAIVGIVNRQGQVAAFAAAGNGDIVSRDAIDPSAGAVGQVLASGRPCYAGHRADDSALAGEATDDSSLATVLAVPLVAGGRPFGWFQVNDKLGGGRFEEDDEQFAVTLATQLAVAYENLSLYQEVGEHATRLEREIVERKRAALALQESEERCRQLLETTSDAVILVDADNRIGYANQAVRNMFGYAPEELVGQGLVALQPERFHQQHRDAFRRYLATGGRTLNWQALEINARHRDGHEFPVEISFSEVMIGGQRHFAGFIRDITLRQQQQERIARLNRIYVVLSGINSAIVRLHERQALFGEACRIAVQLGGFGIAWIGLSDPASGLVHPAAAAGIDLESLADVRLPVNNDRPCPKGLSRETLLRRQGMFCNEAGGGTEDCQCSLQALGVSRGYHSFVVLPLRADGSQVGLMVLYARERDFFDDEELRLLEELAGDIGFALSFITHKERLNYLAYFDSLTGLPNVDLFTDRLGQLLNGAKHDQSEAAVLLFDLEHFKYINDSLGRHIGDELLRQVGHRLEQALRGSDTLARVGADRFAVGLTGLNSGAEAAVLLRDRLFAAVQPPFAIDEHAIEISVKVGVALYPSDGEEPEVLFRDAEAALKQAKASGERYLFYSPEINARMTGRLAMEENLRLAVRNRDFVLHFQPRVDLQSGLIAGAEALIRWRTPDGQLVAPSNFIQLAEETRLIGLIGAWAIESACASLAEWKAAGLQIVPIAVNLSAAQLADDHVLETLQCSLAAHGIDPRYIELELTESAVMRDPEQSVRKLGALRQAGLHLALDDFGTGYSSLAYLKRFPLDAVKIDRVFITDITHNVEDAAIATAVIAMAHRLRLRVIAEGVETEGQLNYVRAHGCDEIQGYYFSQPVPAAEFAAMLAAGKRLVLPQVDDSAAGTILVVDGEADVRLRLAQLFSHDGYRVITAADGREGLELLAVNPVKVIISDQQLHGMTGAEFLDIAKELHPDTMRILLAGDADAGTIADAMSRGALWSSVPKPWENERLRAQVHDAFRRYPSRQAGGTA